jgi:hypothetical protein
MPRRKHVLAETAAAYQTGQPVRHVKLSITLPEDLVAELRAAARDADAGVSGIVAAAIRQSLVMAEQARVDRALELDAEDNAAWAQDALASTARAWADLKW